jgi:hypothetical protein
MYSMYTHSCQGIKVFQLQLRIPRQALNACRYARCIVSFLHFKAISEASFHPPIRRTTKLKKFVVNRTEQNTKTVLTRRRKIRKQGDQM